MLSFEDFKKMDLRIAEILEVNEHPDADKLYVLKINAGDGEKQIVAGIRAAYSPEQLVGRKIVIIDNLEPAVIRGEGSQGMLLAASNEGLPVILVPESDVQAGTRIS